MTIASENTLHEIYAIVDKFNALQPADSKLTKSANTIILGKGGVLDSLGLINFLVCLEDELSGSTGCPIRLIDDRLLTDGQGPLATIGALAIFIEQQRASLVK